MKKLRLKCRSWCWDEDESRWDCEGELSTSCFKLEIRYRMCLYICMCTCILVYWCLWESTCIFPFYLTERLLGEELLFLATDKARTDGVRAYRANEKQTSIRHSRKNRKNKTLYTVTDYSILLSTTVLLYIHTHKYIYICVLKFHHAVLACFGEHTRVLLSISGSYFLTYFSSFSCWQKGISYRTLNRIFLSEFYLFYFIHNEKSPMALFPIIAIFHLSTRNISET